MTVTLFKYLQSELQKQGFNEFVDPSGQIVLFEADHQFMHKILAYDTEVQTVVDRLFNGMSLEQRANDEHFKKAFLYRFINRRINRQTIQAFQLELMTTFMINQQYLNSVYADLDKYLTQESTSDQETSQSSKQTNKQINTQTQNQTSNGANQTDNRSAYADLPHNNVQLDVSSPVMESATNNEISRNKQTHDQTSLNQTDGQTDQTTDGLTDGRTTNTARSYHLNLLLQSNGILDRVFQVFDKKCFMQTW